MPWKFQMGLFQIGFVGTATQKVVVPQVFVIYLIFFQCGDEEPGPRSQCPSAGKAIPQGPKPGRLKRAKQALKLLKKETFS